MLFWRLALGRRRMIVSQASFCALAGGLCSRPPSGHAAGNAAGRWAARSGRIALLPTARAKALVRQLTGLVPNALASDFEKFFYCRQEDRSRLASGLRSGGLPG
jgi:hypothetical protein